MSREQREPVVLTIYSDDDTVFTYEHRTSWWMTKPEGREATPIEECLLSLVTHLRAQLAAAERERDALVRAIDEHCVTALQSTFERGGDAKKAIHDLMFWSQEAGEYFAKQELSELRTRAERAEQIVATVQEALTSALDWVPVPLVACRGDKCREQNCESCYGDEYAEEAVERSQKCRDSIVAALRSLSTTRDGQGEG